ncbi:MAG: hypothetical protein AAFN09_10145 [Pseudomonadota bacterium]
MADTTQKKDPRLLSHNATRRLIGWLGFAFPIALIVYAQFWPDMETLQPTISHFYYTQAGDLLVGVLVAIGVFLVTYQGYEEPDNWPWFLPGDRTAARLAALGAIGVAFFPTDVLNDRSICEVTQAIATCASQTLLDDQDVVTGIAANVSNLHKASAALFFVAIAYFCLALFPLGPKGKPERIAELWLYYACGAVILICLALLAFTLGGVEAGDGPRVFWLETVAVWAFSLAWLVNGETLAWAPGFKTA